VRTCAIYSITNLVTGKCYVGSSLDMRQRINRHFNHLRQGIHYNQKLQRAFDKYGEWAFDVKQIDTCFVSDRAACETMWIERMEAVDCGYNIAKEGMSLLGTPQSPLHVAKRVASKKGYKHSEETKAKLSAAKRGKKMPPKSEVTLEKLRVAGLGRKHSEETKKKMSDIAKHRPAREKKQRPVREKKPWPARLQKEHLARLTMDRQIRAVIGLLCGDNAQ